MTNSEHCGIIHAGPSNKGDVVMNKILSLCIAILLVFAMTSATLAEGKIGVLMPTQSLQRWNQDGANMKELLEAAGYEVNLQFADYDGALQISQIEDMIQDGVGVLVIAPVDGHSLVTVMAKAKTAGITIIAYDRLIMETDAISYYATFDNYMVGTIQGEYIRDRFELDNLEGSINLEFFSGDAGDNNSLFFYYGAYDVISEYIEAGKVIVPSGQIEFAETVTEHWEPAAAQERMANLIAVYYADGANKLDAVLCSNDSIALGATNALISAGFEPEDFPVITGQDCDIANMKNILDGYQAMSIFKDTRVLAAQVVGILEAIFAGKAPRALNHVSYHNGVTLVPSIQCDPKFVDIGNYVELLIDSGYYTADQLEG